MPSHVFLPEGPIDLNSGNFMNLYDRVAELDAVIEEQDEKITELESLLRTLLTYAEEGLSIDIYLASQIEEALKE